MLQESARNALIGWSGWALRYPFYLRAIRRRRQTRVVPRLTQHPNQRVVAYGYRESNVALNRRAKGINTRASVRRKPRSRETWLPQVSAMIEPRPNLHRSWYDYNWDLALTSLLALVLLAGIVLWANVH